MASAAVLNLILSVVAGIGIGALGFLLYRRMLDEKVRNAAEKEAERILSRAKGQVVKIERDAETRAKDFESRARKNLEADIRKEKQKIQNTEMVLKDKEQRLEKDYRRKEEQMANKLRDLEEQSQRLNITEGRLKDMEDQSKRQIGTLKTPPSPLPI
jgi:ribonuclease Y